MCLHWMWWRCLKAQDQGLYGTRKATLWPTIMSFEELQTFGMYGCPHHHHHHHLLQAPHAHHYPFPSFYNLLLFCSITAHFHHFMSSWLFYSITAHFQYFTSSWSFSSLLPICCKAFIMYLNLWFSKDSQGILGRFSTSVLWAVYVQFLWLPSCDHLQTPDRFLLITVNCCKGFVTNPNLYFWRIFQRVFQHKSYEPWISILDCLSWDHSQAPESWLLCLLLAIAARALYWGPISDLQRIFRGFSAQILWAVDIQFLNAFLKIQSCNTAVSANMHWLCAIVCWVAQEIQSGECICNQVLVYCNWLYLFKVP